MTDKINEIIYGRNPVLEAIRQEMPIEKILLATQGEKSFESEVRTLIKGKNIELQFAPRQRLNKYTTSNHQGIVAIITNFTYYTVEELLQHTGKDLPLILLLDHLTDVRNFGAIARSALLLGCNGIIIPSVGSVSVTEDAMKASAGALTQLSVARISNWDDCADKLGSAGIHILASSGKAKKELPEVDFKMPVAIAMGSENKGISRSLESRADGIFKIPQNNLLDSYNVSVAAGIILYQVYVSRNG
jgi:23S rRNA (guanosine2251-2'-O)-methyltransferase